MTQIYFDIFKSSGRPNSVSAECSAEYSAEYSVSVSVSVKATETEFRLMIFPKKKIFFSEKKAFFNGTKNSEMKIFKIFSTSDITNTEPPS